jgi:hypothetical protein
LNFTYGDGQLRLDSNEKGFSPDNVEAICKIGQSTKAGGVHTTQYVGEKGIGFKSVFKVADVVWISSRQYSFKFDKHKPLGMIAPIWAEFPGRLVRGYTSMNLELSGEGAKSEILQELCTLDPRVLMFLRRLRKINVSILEQNKVVSSTTLTRTDKYDHDESTIQLQHNTEFLHYKVTKHHVNNLPSVAQRNGVSQSDVLLAFPMKDNEPELAEQQVFAFLPIRSYGFAVGDGYAPKIQENSDPYSQ